mmetsp:Transcript_31475/g.97871  ORF Transcript_31475/g.97871 Transcript_31475/m.97871 type:complete len:223 (-) Transcript_31475:345-1013(-)
MASSSSMLLLAGSTREGEHVARAVGVPAMGLVVENVVLGGHHALPPEAHDIDFLYVREGVAGNGDRPRLAQTLFALQVLGELFEAAPAHDVMRALFLQSASLQAGIIVVRDQGLPDGPVAPPVHGLPCVGGAPRAEDATPVSVAERLHVLGDFWAPRWSLEEKPFPLEVLVGPRHHDLRGPAVRDGTVVPRAALPQDLDVRVVLPALCPAMIDHFSVQGMAF